MNEAMTKEARWSAWFEAAERRVAENASLSPRAAEIGRSILSCRARGIGYFVNACENGGWREKLHAAFTDPAIASVLDILKAGSDEYEALRAIIGDEYAADLRRMWVRALSYTYEKSCYRRSYHAEKYDMLHLVKNVDMMLALIGGVALGFGVDAYLESLRTPNRGEDEPDSFGSENDYVAPYLALKLDEGDAADALLARICEIVNDDAGRAEIRWPILRGLLMSHRSDAHESVGNLLLAARLQEGLRQAIVEMADDASLPAFKYLLRLMAGENLIRFSSVARAFGVWVGLDVDVMKPKRLAELFQTACVCADDEALCREVALGDDAERALIAYWGVSLEGVERAEPLLTDALRSGPKHRKIAALAFISQIGNVSLAYRLAKPCLADEACWGDRELMAWATHIFGYFRGTELLEAESRWCGVAAFDGTILAATADGVRDLYAILKGLAEGLEKLAGSKAKSFCFEESIPGMRVEYGRQKILEYMTRLLSRESDRYYFRLDDEEETPPEGARENPWGIDTAIFDTWQKPESTRIDALDDMRLGGVALRDDLCSYLSEMDADTRGMLLREVVRRGVTPVQRDVLIRSMGDRSGWNASAAWSYVKDEPFTDAEIRTIEAFLRFKDGRTRQMIFMKLLSQTPLCLAASIERLLADKDKMCRQAGAELRELLARRADDPAYAPAIATCSAAPKPEESAVQAAVADEPEKGYGLFDPASGYRRFEMPGLPESTSLLDLFAPDESLAKKVFQAIVDAIEANKDVQYRGARFADDEDGGGETVVLGYEEWFVPVAHKFFENAPRRSDDRLTLDCYPLTEIWRGIVRDCGLDADALFALEHASFFVSGGWGQSVPKWLRELRGGAEVIARAEAVVALKEKSPYRWKIGNLIAAMLREFQDGAFDAAQGVVRWIVGQSARSVAAKKSDAPLPIRRHKGYAEFLGMWLRAMERFSDPNAGDGRFAEYFKYAYEFGYGADGLEGEHGLIYARDVAYALRDGLLTEAETMALLFRAGRENRFFYDLTAPRLRKNLEAISPALLEIADRAVTRVVEIETERGEMPTSVSTIAGDIDRYMGARHFVRILERVGRDPFERNVWIYRGEASTKKVMLSYLLSHCHPADGEDARVLAACLEGRGVSEQRLIDGAMYAPQWVGIVADFLGWPGLASACWYFHAHVNEHFSAEKETMVARFSDVAPKDFNDGAFDVDWFREAHDTLGAARFEKVYAAAKYISAGANHRRSQLFADSVTGKISLADAEREIREKRAKNYVLCYALIPLDAQDPARDAAHRYEVLQAFLKESRQFGAQRRESETRAVDIAVANLARNAGYASATRFVWRVESDKLREVEDFLSPHRVGDVDLWVEIDEQGRSGVRVEKGGKALKSVPAKLKKDAYVEAAQATARALKDQHARARAALERAMERAEVFEADEIRRLLPNPVIGPLMRNLLFAAGTRFFFGDRMDADEAAPLVVAHPVHLHDAGVWADYQREVFERKIVQPFKQIFRELYTPTVDDLGASQGSLRYAGHQVQPRRGVALLRTRGWTVHYEEGLQKVFLAENLIAEIYAAADWFSPADVECPTLSSVIFRSRRDGKVVPVADVPKIIFSEVMRDVDLMVSVAHAGGVDPEASHSTVEMRVAVAAEAVRLFKLDNVRFEGAHAFIKGTRGDYTVHMGSGTIHRAASGAMAVLAVPSQHRGRLFLPFVDDDPRTAEVVSKILLLAEDAKIKDPAILSQMHI